MNKFKTIKMIFIMKKLFDLNYLDQLITLIYKSALVKKLFAY